MSISSCNKQTKYTPSKYAYHCKIKNHEQHKYKITFLLVYMIYIKPIYHEYKSKKIETNIFWLR